MMNWRRSLLIGAFALNAGNGLYADIISQALSSLPAQTGYVEYENLTSLRKLRDYDRLRQRFSGKPLQKVRIALGQLGIREDQVNELVVASNPTEFYGIAAGTFREQSSKRNGIQKDSVAHALDSQALCPASGTCLLFLEDSVAAFGTLSQLREMVRAREGSTTRLTSNSTVVSLLNSTNNQAPVRGVLVGDQLETAISDVLRDWTGWNRDWSRVSASIRDFGYSVEFDKGAHLTATVKCRSATSATLLLQMLRLLDSMQSMPIARGNADAGLPFRNLHASLSGSTVVFRADTQLFSNPPTR